MKLPRRQFLHLAVGAAALPAVSRFARAQAYPTRPVRIIIGFPAGTTSDIIARLLGQWLSERLSQPFLIENRLGAASTIATEFVVRAPADGYTLLLITSANPINTAVYQKLNYDFLRDIVPIAGISRGPLVMVVNPSIPAKTVPEFIAYAKANPATSTSDQVVSGACFRSPASCSSGWQASTWLTCRFEALLPPSPLCLAGRSRSCSTRWARQSRTSGPASYVRWR